MIFNVGQDGVNKADKVKYDNTTSGLEATEVQGAIDELNSDLADLNVRYDTDSQYIQVRVDGEWTNLLKKSYRTLYLIGQNAQENYKTWLFGTDGNVSLTQSYQELRFKTSATYSIIGTAVFPNLIDFSKHSKLHVEGVATLTDSRGLTAGVKTGNGVESSPQGVLKKNTVSANGTFTIDLDISDVTQSGYIYINVYQSSSGNSVITNIYLE